MPIRDDFLLLNKLVIQATDFYPHLGGKGGNGSFSLLKQFSATVFCRFEMIFKYLYQGFEILETDFYPLEGARGQTSTSGKKPLQ